MPPGMPRKGDAGDRLWAITAMCLAVALAGAAAITFFPWPTAASWPAIAMSGLLHVGYKLFALRRYRSGDLSETYPIARGSLPMLIALGAAAFAGERLDCAGVLGILLACGGIPFARGKGAPIAPPVRQRRFARRTIRSPTRHGFRIFGAVR